MEHLSDDEVIEKTRQDLGIEVRRTNNDYIRWLAVIPNESVTINAERIA